ncbi:MAG TPA: SCO1664 family protein [Acidimicrobiales bacterium]|nr:SCO1664 family protein [Acidimicrobiales bacterium]
MTVLAAGEIVIEGRMPWSSNQTLLTTVTCGGASIRAVYKPESGERPLWDYPHGLWRREVATYVVSEALGWDLVPETVSRFDAPMGQGSLQRFVEDADFEQHYFTLLDDESTHDRLRQMCVFDLVVNNADRKGGHCLITSTGQLFGVDHGLTFQPVPRLRTVIWEFGGQPIPPAWRDDLRRVADAPLAALDDLLDAPEIAALRRRCLAVADLRQIPDVSEDYRHYPWPYV